MIKLFAVFVLMTTKAIAHPGHSIDIGTTNAHLHSHSSGQILHLLTTDPSFVFVVLTVVVASTVLYLRA